MIRVDERGGIKLRISWYVSRSLKRETRGQTTYTQYTVDVYRTQNSLTKENLKNGCVLLLDRYLDKL